MDPGPSLSEPFIGEIKLLPGTFAPKGWAYCEGQLLPISSHSALFSLLGTTFGGDGKEKFKLPKIPPMKIPNPEKESKEPSKEPEKEPDKSQQTSTEIPPYLEIPWIIALNGIFPSRE